MVLTVGSTPTWIDVYNKGYDLLIAAARLLTDYQFVFVNVEESWLERMEQEFHYRALPNLEIHSFIPQTELYELYSKASIYAQPSLSEGMPNALAEAMLYECVPVGSNVAGIPTVIDKYGVVIDKRDAAQLAQAIQKASEMDSGPSGAQFIRTRFSLEIRRQQVADAVLSLLSD